MNFKTKLEMLVFIRKEPLGVVEEVCEFVANDPLCEIEVLTKGTKDELIAGLKAVPSAVLLNAIENIFFDSEDEDLDEGLDEDIEESEDDEENEDEDREEQQQEF